MTTIHTRARVAADGTVTIPVGAAEAGREVEIVVSPVATPETINGIPRDEWFALLKRTAGSISDPTFQRPPQGTYQAREL